MPRAWIKREAKAVRESHPGRRFEDAHERHRIGNHALRVTVITIGCVLMALAALTFWVPGPNFVVVIASLIVVAGQWRLVARWLDRGEVAGRRWHEQTWEPMPRARKRAAIFAMWLAGALVGCAMLYLSWRQGMLDWLPYV